MSVSSQPEIDLNVTPNAGVEVKKFMAPKVSRPSRAAFA